MYFKYKALKNGVTKKGRMGAATSSAVIDYLKKNEYFPVSVTEVKKQESSILNSIFDQTNFNDIVDFTRQIAIMLNAGLTLIDSLEILKKQITKLPLRKMIEEIDTKIKGGSSYSEALSDY